MKGARLVRIAAAAAGLTMTAACGGDRTLPGAAVLGELEPGAPRSEVLEALPPGALAEGAAGPQASGYAVERYFVDGSAIEVVWVTDPAGEPEGANPRSSRNPVIFRDDVLDGWGWAHFDRRVADWGLRVPGGAGDQPTPPPSRERDGGPPGQNAWRSTIAESTSSV